MSNSTQQEAIGVVLIIFGTLLGFSIAIQNPGVIATSILIIFIIYKGYTMTNPKKLT